MLFLVLFFSMYRLRTQEHSFSLNVIEFFFYRSLRAKKVLNFSSSFEKKKKKIFKIF